MFKYTDSLHSDGILPLLVNIWQNLTLNWNISLADPDLTGVFIKTSNSVTNSKQKTHNKILIRFMNSK